MSSPATKAQTRPEERFLASFDLHSGQSLNGTTPAMGDRRKEAMERFHEQGLPSRKSEAYKYTNIAALFSRDYDLKPAAQDPELSPDVIQELDLPDVDAHRVVLVNGRFDSVLSDIEELPEGVVVTGLAEAGTSHGKVIDEHYGQYARTESNPFIALNTAFAQDGAFIYVPSGKALELPVHIVHLTTVDEPRLFHPRNLFVVENGAIATVVETRHALGSIDTLANPVTEIFVGRDARFDHYNVQNEGDHASLHTTTDVYQSGNSFFSTSTFLLSGDVIRNNLHITADGEHCESHLLGLYLGNGQNHFDNATLVDHTAPDCFSNELYKGVLDDQSTGVFNGKVFVHRDSQRINAYQSNKSILLTNEADIFSKPELEIYADDVQCSHGSTTGQLDEEAIFYLRSRGLNEQQARRMLLHAFALDVVEEVSLDSLRSWLDGLVKNRFN